MIMNLSLTYSQWTLITLYVFLQCLAISRITVQAAPVATPYGDALTAEYFILPFLPSSIPSDSSSIGDTSSIHSAHTSGDRYRCKAPLNSKDEDKDHDTRGHHHQHSPQAFHWRGTSLGGWLVLEPWLTPSLFYQFLGANERGPSSDTNNVNLSDSEAAAKAGQRVGIDSLTFCQALGEEDANRQLRVHWATWVRDSDLERLVHRQGVQTLRIPVADWMFVPYAPFKRCWDGSINELDRVLNTLLRLNVSAVLDVHALRGSQNGLDNSGSTGHYHWFYAKSTENTPPGAAGVGSKNTDRGDLYYEHWRVRGGDWAGMFDEGSQSYLTLNETNMLHSLEVVRRIAERYKDHPAVVGVQPVNEPSQSIPMSIIQEYYWRTYNIVRKIAPGWTVLLHDSFRLTPQYWGRGSGFLEDCDHYAVDTHLYQAWADPTEDMNIFVESVCGNGERLQVMESLGVPIVVGEWSLATDNCAMWLNGFNDNVPGFPKVQCTLIPCPEPYMGRGLIPNTPPDPTKPALGPFGAGGPSYVSYGLCPVDKRWTHEQEDVQRLSYAALNAYDSQTHGFFFWNFRTELGEVRWDYGLAVERGWLPRDWNAVLSAGDRGMVDGEWAGIKRGIRDGCLSVQSKTTTTDNGNNNRDKDMLTERESKRWRDGIAVVIGLFIVVSLSVVVCFYCVSPTPSLSSFTTRNDEKGGSSLSWMSSSLSSAMSKRTGKYKGYTTISDDDSSSHHSIEIKQYP